VSTSTLKTERPQENGPQSLADIFLRIQQSGKSGTLRLTGPDGRVKYVYFRNGVVELLKTSKAKTLLGRALVKRRKLSDQQLQAALERQAAGQYQLRLGQILIGMGIIPADELEKALKSQIAEEILELFTWVSFKSEFIRGDPPLDVFEAEDLQARVLLEPKKLVTEAERRTTELEAIRRYVPSFHDVYVPVGDAAERTMNRSDAGPERDVISCADGQRDVHEMLDEVHAPDLLALRALAKLVQAGDVAAVAPAQLMALGQECEDRREFERSRRRYLRAEELGHPDFDLPRRIGQIDEVMGDLGSACDRYVAYADRCTQAGYPDVAVATLGRVLDLAKTQLVGTPQLKTLEREARTKLAAILEKSGRADEASAEYMKLLADLPADAPIDERIRAISAILNLDNRADLREQLADLYLQQGDQAQAIMELQDVAATALADGAHDKGIVVLEKILSIDPHEILTHQQLASTLAATGNKTRAVAEYLKIAEHIQEMGLASASAQTLVQIYEKVVELDPRNSQARKWLTQAYEGKAEADKVIAHVRGMAEALRNAGDRKDELLAALDKLGTYLPDDHALALERAKLKKELGKTEDARAAFKALADAAVKAKDHGLAHECLQEVIAATPGDLEAQLALVRVESQESKGTSAARRCGAVFELAFVSGKLDLADEAVKRAIDIEPDAPVHRERSARLHEAKAQPQEAAKTLVKAARLARSEEDFGTARAWLKRALELDPASADALELLEQVKRPMAVASTTPAEGTSPAAPVPVAPVRYEPQAAKPGSQRIMPTITGGGMGSIQIQGVTTKRVGGIADRLKELKGGGPAEGEPMAPRDDTYKPPAEANEEVVKQKARSAMDRLRAIKSGAPPPPKVSSETPSGSSETAAPATPATNEAPAGTPGSSNTMADATVSKKANSAMDRLRALKSGAPTGGAAAQPAAEVVKPSADLPAGTPGSANTMADPAIAKKASSARDKLRALKGGGPMPAAPAPAPPPEEPKPATVGSASDDAIQALAAEASAQPQAAPPPPPPPAEPPPPPPPVREPSTGKLPRLPKPGAKANDLPPGTPGSSNTMAAPELAKKASSAMDRLKALKSGAPPKPSQPAPTPETQTSASEPSAAGGAPPAGTPGSTNTMAAPELAKKASSAMERLKALKGGGGAAPAAGAAPGGPMPQKISKGPEAPGEAADPALSKKASSARDRLKAMRGGGTSASSAGSPAKDAGQANDETPANGGAATAATPGSEATA
jgi:tetratricopeptide (TPR) repeat protein